MSILSNFDETLNRTECFIWYNDVFIPFIYNRIDALVKNSMKTYSLYTTFKPDILYDGLNPPPNFTEWAIDNGKFKYSTCDTYIQKLQFTNEFRHDYYRYRDSQEQSKYYNYRYKFTGVEIVDPQYRPVVTIKANYSV